MNRLTTICLITSLATVAVAAHAQQNQVVNFKQMPHVALGSANLSVGPNDRYLRVRNTGQQGGFRTILPQGATSWNALAFLKNSMSGSGQQARLSLNPIADGQNIAPMTIQWLPDGFSAQVEFTSTQDPVYEVRVFDSDDLVNVWRCVPDSPGGFCVPDDEPDPPTGGGPTGGVVIIFELPPEIDVDDPTLFPTFSQLSSADCQYQLSLPASARISIGGIDLGTGDSIAITEQARPGDARYPYTFDAIDVVTSARQMLVPHERAR